MDYQYYISKTFKRQIKPHLKKYPSLIDDIILSLQQFDKQSSIALGADTYKVRVRPRHFHKGKSGAFRMVVLVLEIDKIIAPLFFYFKGDLGTVSKKDIIDCANKIRKELKSE